MSPRQAPKRFISASQVGEYLFCAHSWWLHRVQGLSPGNTRALIEGQEAHHQHGQRARRTSALTQLGYLLIMIAVILGLLALGLYLLGDEFA
jgi:hypothetical protein